MERDTVTHISRKGNVAAKLTFSGMLFAGCLNAYLRWAFREKTQKIGSQKQRGKFNATPQPKTDQTYQHQEYPHTLCFRTRALFHLQTSGVDGGKRLVRAGRTKRRTTHVQRSFKGNLDIGTLRMHDGRPLNQARPRMWSHWSREPEHEAVKVGRRVYGQKDAKTDRERKVRHASLHLFFLEG